MSIYAALTEGDFSLRESLTYACRLANKLETDLVGISAMPDPARAVLMTGVSMHGMMVASGGTLAEGIREAQKEAREKLEDLFKTVCDAEGLPEARRRVDHMVGLPSDIYPRMTLLSQAFITPHECVSEGNDHGLAFETTLLDRRQPVIACGTDASPDPTTVIVAWDGSPEAARAVRFHTATLQAADTLIIAQNANRIDGKDRHGSEDPSVVQSYLDTLGLKGEVQQFNGKIAHGLLNLAKETGAGVIVAGAFGHNRLEEFIFGGVSRNLLRAEHGPALALAH